jgi:hypothetical protein
MFGRRSTVNREAAATARGDVAVPGPDQPSPACTEGNCSSGAPTLCSYVDRRRQECGTAWCPAHQQIVFGRVFCRRHARTVTAFGPFWASQVLPDLENRAPSFANWASGYLDAPIRELFARFYGSPMLSVSPLGIGLSQRDRTWGYSWKLVAAQGVDLSIKLIVPEADQNMVRITYNGAPFREWAAPWVQAPQLDVPRDSATDQDARQRLFTRIVDDLEAAIEDTVRNPWRPAAHRQPAVTATGWA